MKLFFRLTDGRWEYMEESRIYNRDRINPEANTISKGIVLGSGGEIYPDEVDWVHSGDQAEKDLEAAIRALLPPKPHSCYTCTHFDGSIENEHICRKDGLTHHMSIAFIGEKCPSWTDEPPIHPAFGENYPIVGTPQDIAFFNKMMNSTAPDETEVEQRTGERPETNLKVESKSCLNCIYFEQHADRMWCHQDKKQAIAPEIGDVFPCNEWEAKA